MDELIHEKKERKNKAIARLVIDIPSVIHQEVKKMAAFQGITIRRYVCQAVVEKLRNDHKYMQQG